VNDTDLKAKDTIRESRDVLLVRSIWNMMACNVHVAEFILEVKEKVNEKNALYYKRQLKMRSKRRSYVK